MTAVIIVMLVLAIVAGVYYYISLAKPIAPAIEKPDTSLTNKALPGQAKSVQLACSSAIIASFDKLRMLNLYSSRVNSYLKTK